MSIRQATGNFQGRDHKVISSISTLQNSDFVSTIRRTFRNLVLAGSAAAGLHSLPLHAAAFQNGDFENGTSISNYQYIYSGDTTSVPGWSTDGDFTYIGTFWNAFHGDHSIQLVPGSTVSQTFDTIETQAYTLSFELSKNPNYSGAISGVVLFDESFPVPISFSDNNTSSDMMWTYSQVLFYGLGATTTISFLATTDTGGFGLALDDVKINGATGSVPEPATWAMMVSGFGIAGTALRRRKVATSLRFA